MKHPLIRIGQGWDIHCLVPGRPLILGGVTVPFDKGALGHSDADALLHAIIDALLGAAALGDIGRHFPDTDPRYRGVDSRFLLQQTAMLLQKEGFTVGNIDTTILLEQPKLAAYLPLMRENIAKDVKIKVEQVNIKAKTFEKMGPVGEGEAVEAQAICLLFESAEEE